MTRQRPIDLNPSVSGWPQAYKITYPPTESRRRMILIEAMRFIPHDGKATA